MINDAKILEKVRELNWKAKDFISYVQAYNPNAHSDRMLESILETAEEIKKLHDTQRPE